MSFIRLPDDYEPAARCATCDEFVLLSEAVFHENEHFHSECRPDLVRCAWCGLWLYKTEAKQIGEEFYHPVCFLEVT